MFDHPNLIRFFGVVQEDPQLNIFVEWMPGGSVSKLLDKHGSFNDNVIMKYTYQILQGLDYLHHHGILHRDLKGKNFMYASRTFKGGFISENNIPKNYPGLEI